MIYFFALRALMMPITVDFPKRMLSSSGRCAGQVNMHEPHSMHEVMSSASAFSQRCCEETVASR